MKFPFFRKISAWHARISESKKRGAMLIVTAFLFLAFTTLSLGLIVLSQVYLKIGGFRKNSALLDYSSENGIKSGFLFLSGAINAAPASESISEERYAELLAATRNSELAALEEALKVRFPLLIQEESGQMAWKSQTGCRVDRISEAEGFFLARFGLSIDSEGRLKGFSPQKVSTFDARIDVLAGQAPLPFLPFLLTKKLAPEEKENFAEKNRIALEKTGQSLLSARPILTEDDLIPRDAIPLLEKAMNIKIFRPQGLSAAKLRFALGLEESNEPVPEGVYLIHNDLGLGGVYVEGDTKEMIMAVEDGFQVISFRMDAGLWTLRFSPSQGLTRFSGPGGHESFDLVPLGIIICDGKIESLGGGIVDGEGNAILVKDQEIPSILQGINLTLVAADKITITSHLLRQGLKWQDGIPYVKEESGQLIIHSTGQDLLSGYPLDGGITIDGGSPQDLKIQASLAAQGEGFRVEGEEKTVRLLGGLQTVDYVSGGNELHLTPLAPSTDADMLLLNAPQTTQPILFLSLFKALQWKEF
ncbi:MAG: hypothetical protein AB1715_11670 [Acidobacteriota bacterium]